jgi:S1-C subfamily serine protease
MQDPYVDNQTPLPYQAPTQPVLTPYQDAPGQMHAPPYIPPETPRRSAGGARTGAIIALTLLLALIFGVGLFAGWQFGRTSNTATNTSALQTGTAPAATVPPLTGNDLQAVREAVIAKVKPSVVQVNVTLQGGSGIGSGVIVDRRGYIVTNNHVVNGAQSIEVVLYDGTRLPAQLVGTDPADDLAVLKITPPSKGLTVATLGDSSKLQVGQEVLAIGNPLGITQTVTNGIISALGRSVSEGRGGATIANAIQTDAPINPGNSGGALVDLQGNLVGIPTLSAIDPEFNTPANGVGFAIPSNRVAFVVPQIIASGSVTHTGRAYLGVRVADVDANLAAQDNLAVDHGALIVSVVSNGPAASAGLQAGDVIVQLDNKPVNDSQSLTDILVNENPGNTVGVKVYRGNQQLTINVKLGELPSGS